MTLRDQRLLFFSLPRHDEAYTSTPWQLASELAANNDVFFIDHPYTFLELIKRWRSKEIRKRIGAYFGKRSVWSKEVEIVLAPFVWPVNFLPQGKLYDFFSRWNERIVAGRLNRFFAERRINAIVYINSFEFYYPGMTTYLKPRILLSVYHCIDPIIKSFSRKHGPYLQQMAAAQADVIISTSPSLRDNFKREGYVKNYLIPNAANFALFNSALRPQLEIHPSVREIRGKVVGFLGNIERRTDFDLLLHAMHQLTDWTLVMAGPVEKQWIPDELLNHPRVKFTGAVSHEEAPSVIRRFDVTVIPFRCDEASHGIYPLKLFEYLAAGKPLVTTDFNPEVLNMFADVIEVAKSNDDFVDKVKRAQLENNETKIQQRVIEASRNTWSERALLFGNVVRQHLS